MRCVDCKFFYRLDLRCSPGRVVCAKSGIIDEDTNARYGCELGRMKGFSPTRNPMVKWGDTETTKKAAEARWGKARAKNEQRL